jgi:hypothetical protein
MPSLRSRLPGGQQQFNTSITKEITKRIIRDGDITPLEVLVTGMRIAWERSVKAGHKDHNFITAMAAAEKAAPYMHSRLAPIDPQLQQMLDNPIRVVVQRLTRPAAAIANGNGNGAEPEMVDETEEGVIIEEVSTPRDHYQERNGEQRLLEHQPDPPPKPPRPGMVETVAEVDIKLLREKAAEMRRKTAAARVKRAQELTAKAVARAEEVTTRKRPGRRKKAA